MATITAADVKKLRDLTGAGMMECKKALEESDGDIDKAIEALRISGAAKAAKRGAERTTANGLVASQDNVMVELLCETDFVAKSEDFQALAGTIVQTAAQLQVAPRVQRSVDRRLRFTLQRLLLNPNHYHNLQVRARTLTGRQAQGRFDGVNTRGEVVIRQTLSGTDEATFQLRPEDIRSIELLEP